MGLAFGRYNLTKVGATANMTITTAATVFGDTIALGPRGLAGFNMWAGFTYGSGGTSVKAYVQTGWWDADTTIWNDVACFAFTTASKSRWMNIAVNTSLLTATDVTDGTLADNTALAGSVAGLVRLKVVSLGTYAGGTTLKVRAAVK